MAHKERLDQLLKTIARLRAEDGCPWDRAQTHLSLIPYLKEESAEVIDAIHEIHEIDSLDKMGKNSRIDVDTVVDSKDLALKEAALEEELGDLLLQILLHCEIARERNTFDFSDVMVRLNDKMIRRHPHLFAGKKYQSIAEQKADWARIKAEERVEKGLLPETSLLAGIPKALSPLKQAELLQKRAATVGFDWEEITPVIEKVEEERQELAEAMGSGEREAIQSELGDLLFSLVNLARFLEIDPEEALQSTNLKFRRRFNYIEQQAEAPLEELSLEDLDRYWNAAKRGE
ncbi:nucleoside triphosphate pyrophosphohydrolase [Ignatzschineria cameli]|uniref:nucleoside triphosphate pyrophosphohydrolase n=1 Tax=Ignatzschineria cameli TaxID=2182793 RepID=UPI000D6195ED|nr:nucleoside triphosphate pyrophosphohydrolase [Ignatzschineria cameli]PWD85633.1 nucleoside triphosphate pyrophosphohydrolase [Ignatzschineria cameli]